MAKKYYAYFLENGAVAGIVDNWDRCKVIVQGQKARYKGFITEAEAKSWLNSGAEYAKKDPKDRKKAAVKKESLKQALKPGIYFDAGTGRGIGTEVRVTTERGENIIAKLVPKEKITEHGNFLAHDKTNNFGELLGCFIALKIALKEHVKAIFGDSKLVLDYWSKGRYNRDNLTDVDTIKLIEKVAILRQEFENAGGKLTHVSGDINPADLGFHR